MRMLGLSRQSSKRREPCAPCHSSGTLCLPPPLFDVGRSALPAEHLQLELHDLVAVGVGPELLDHLELEAGEGLFERVELAAAHAGDAGEQEATIAALLLEGEGGVLELGVVVLGPEPGELLADARRRC